VGSNVVTDLLGFVEKDLIKNNRVIIIRKSGH
jgi:hypothetical protein